MLNTLRDNGVEGPGPDRFLAPARARRPGGARRRRPGRRAVRHRPPGSPDPATHVSPTRGDHHGRRPSGPRPARHHPHRPQAADRGPHADAHEQPRPRGGRAPRRPRRLRRHRPGGP
nr:hypothetical protein [Angustibacter aerolatus]